MEILHLDQSAWAAVLHAVNEAEASVCVSMCVHLRVSACVSVWPARLPLVCVCVCFRVGQCQ